MEENVLFFSHVSKKMEILGPREKKRLNFASSRQNINVEAFKVIFRIIFNIDIILGGKIP